MVPSSIEAVSIRTGFPARFGIVTEIADLNAS
jgi:hypothetical protein